MPELPEVETIVRGLRAAMTGARVISVDVHLPKMVHLSVRTLRRRIVGSRVARVHRRAKLVLVGLSVAWTIVIHLKMSGQLIWRQRRGRLVVGGHPIPGGVEALPNRYSHVILGTDRGTLFFNDQRQFGFLKLVRSSSLERWLEAQGFGPEPLSAGFTETVWQSILGRVRRRRLKSALLDQRVIAGVGNIYADEACHVARIRPTRRVSSLRPTDRRALYRGLRRVLRLSLRHGGTTADAYRRANGQPGGMQPFLRVYGRQGRPCRRCGGTIVKIVLAQRGTHFCPDCQR